MDRLAKVTQPGQCNVTRGQTFLRASHFQNFSRGSAEISFSELRSEGEKEYTIRKKITQDLFFLLSQVNTSTAFLLQIFFGGGP